MAIDRKQLGLAIRELRKARGLTQVNLASAAGLSGSGNTVAMIERGERGVSIDTLNNLAEALKVDAACLTVLGSTVPSDSSTSKLMQTLRQTVISSVKSANKPPRRRTVTAVSNAESLEMRQLKSAIAAVVLSLPAPEAVSIDDSQSWQSENSDTASELGPQRMRDSTWIGAHADAQRIVHHSPANDSQIVDDVMTWWHSTDWWQDESAAMN